jgi:hypothetical protein
MFDCMKKERALSAPDQAFKQTGLRDYSNLLFAGSTWRRVSTNDPIPRNRGRSSKRNE